MKIVHLALSSPFSIGYNYHENDLPSAQANSGFDVAIVARNSEYNNGVIQKCNVGTQIINDGIKLIRVYTKQKRINSFVHPKKRTILKILDKEKPDFIWVHSITNYSLIVACKYKKKHPSVIVCADNHLDKENTKLDFLHRVLFHFFGKRNKKFSKFVSFFYGVTPGRVRFMIDYLGVPSGKAKLSIMGASFSKQEMSYTHSSCKSDLLKTIHSENKKTFIFVTGGKIDKKKRIIETIEVFNAISNKEKRLLLFGSISPEIEVVLKQYIDNNEQISYLGWMNSQQVTKLFIGADFGIFLGGHSTLWEKALSCGLPCAFGQKDGFEHLYNGSSIFCNDYSQKEFVDILNSISTYNDFYKQLLKNSLSKKDTFNYLTIVKKINDDLGL